MKLHYDGMAINLWQIYLTRNTNLIEPHKWFKYYVHISKMKPFVDWSKTIVVKWPSLRRLGCLLVEIQNKEGTGFKSFRLWNKRARSFYSDVRCVL